MSQAIRTESFESILSSHVEMCYAVAIALTRDPVTASHLTRDVITSAWHLRRHASQPSAIKQWLLTKLRETFLEQYQDSLENYQDAPLRFPRVAVTAGGS